MALLIPVTLFGWLLLVVGIFKLMQPRRAAVVSFMLAILFLPNYSYGLPGLPDYSKTTAASLGVLIAMLFTDFKRLEKFKFITMDAFMLFWCLTPVLASLANGLGIYDGFSAMKNYVIAWAFPYMIGRLYFVELFHFEEIARGIFIGGLLYLPFCVLEILLSPQFHNWTYGFHPHEFQQSIRGSTYRPVVFMGHGLMVGMWMMAATWIGFLAWKHRRFEGNAAVFGLNLNFAVFLLFIVFIACQSYGAIVFLVVLFLCYSCNKILKSKFPIYLLLLLPLVYVGVRMSGIEIVDFIMYPVENNLGEERSGSLRFRLENEELLITKALEKRVFGWGGWGRSRIYNYEGEDISIADSLWIIIAGSTGFAGLAGLYAILGIPLIQFFKHMPVRWMEYKNCQAAVAVAYILLMYLCDNLLNDMKNPVFIMIAGGLANITKSDWKCLRSGSCGDQSYYKSKELPTILNIRYL